MSERTLVAIAPGPATRLAGELSSAAHDLDEAGARARALLRTVDRPSGAPALLEDVAGWAHRVSAELTARIEDVVALDAGVTGTEAGAPASYLDARAVGGIEELLLGLAGLGMLDACPRPGDAVGRRAAIAALPSALVARLTEQLPEVLGRTDGVPFVVRDRANRILLDEEVRRLEGLGAGRSSEEEQLLRAFRDWRDDRGLLLVKLEPARGRVVLARGTLDTAGHVAVLVPGAGASIGGLARRQLAWMDGLQAQMAAGLVHGGSPGRGTAGAATVLWLDYDAPEQLVPDAVRRTAATDAARRLPAFLEGIASVEREVVTTLGHSYGSVVLGRALADHGPRLATDRIVALGSPGMGVQFSHELGLREDQRLFATTLPGDPIVLVGRRQPLVGDVWRAIHGPDPRRLRAAERIDLPTHDLDDADAVERHLQYLAPGSAALRSLAALATARALPPSRPSPSPPGARRPHPQPG